MKNALAYNKQPIPLIVVYNNNASISAAESYINVSKRSYTQIFASDNLPSSLISYAKSLNYTVKLESKANMTPSFTEVSVGNFSLNTWPLIGLLSSPELNPSITNGSVGDSYEISGAAPTTLAYAQKLNYATNTSKTIASILTGGALPVQVIVGTPTSIPPTLGKSSLDISIIALITAIVLVSIFIVIRYRRVFLVGPILITTLLELFIIISVIGLVGTIDLSAFAGMIAVVGTGVDAQIIITDEILSRKNTSESSKSILGNAFYIVWADALLLIIAMLPLFFSTSLVEVIGFSESTIIGALMGVLVTRPAYGAIVSRHYAN
jgi:preprotein translocase subunit SecD